MCSSPTGNRSRTALFQLPMASPRAFQVDSTGREAHAALEHVDHIHFCRCGMTCGELYRPQPSAAPQLTRVMPASPKLLCKCWPVICISRDVTQLPLCDILLSRGLDISLVIIHSFSARFGGLNFHDQFSWIYCSP
jgi:hypothetical protein